MRLSKSRFLRVFFGLLLTLAMLTVTAHSQAFGASESVLFNFNALGTGATGSYPHSTPIMDASGNLYGTAPNGGLHNEGVVWELSPPTTSGGMWTQTILWNFNNNGTDGYLAWTWGSGLVMDSHGNLYGTTQRGGAYDKGTVWELSPPATSGGLWIETILYSFGKPRTTDGINPTSGLTRDKNGHLYGTTLYGQTSSGGGFDGSVYELSPPSAGGGPGWKETILMQFAAGGAGNPYLKGFFPYAGVIGDGSGDLFGTTSAGGSYYGSSDPGGVLFEINAGGGYSVLWNFGGTYGPSSVDDAADPVSGLIMDKLGNIYGTSALGGTSADFATGVGGVGTVFELSPPGKGGGKWTESILWNFHNNGTDGFSPVAGVVIDPKGNLYGTTEYGGLYSDEPYVGGTVYKLTPPTMGGGSWGETILWNFGNPASTDGSLPWASLLIVPSGNLFGTTLDGGSFGVVGNGTVYEISFASPTPTPTKEKPTPTPTPTHTPSKTPTPSATATVVPGTPTISSIPGTILVGASFNIMGTGFTAGSVVNFFIATADGPKNFGPLTPTSPHSAVLLSVDVPDTTPLGEGFVSVEVVNTDTDFKVSNLAYALLQGDAAKGIPSLTSINGVGLAATSSNPAYATNNVDTVVLQNTKVKLGGTGFDTTNGVGIDLFCACPALGGKIPTVFLNPGNNGLTSTLLTFLIPPAATLPTGPGSFVISNAGAAKAYLNKSNAVSVPIGAVIHVLSVSQTATTVTVNGTGFSPLTVINLFNKQPDGTVENLGGLMPSGAPNIPLTLVNSTQFTFKVPAGANPGPSYVQALNPPFVPYTSSGNDPGGSFTLK